MLTEALRKFVASSGPAGESVGSNKTTLACLNIIQFQWDILCFVIAALKDINVPKFFIYLVVISRLFYF